MGKCCYHHEQCHNSPLWDKAFLRSFRHQSLFLAAPLQFLTPKFLASPVTPYSHLSLGLPFCLLPSTTEAMTLLAVFWSSSRMKCPTQIRRLSLMYVIMSLYLYSLYNLSLYFILYYPLSFVDLKRALKTFHSKPPILTSSDFDCNQVSEPYARTGLIRVLNNIILFLKDKNCDQNCLFNPYNFLLASKILFQLKCHCLHLSESKSM